MFDKLTFLSKQQHRYLGWLIKLAIHVSVGLQFFTHLRNHKPIIISFFKDFQFEELKVLFCSQAFFTAYVLSV